jgi:hypothetical protein
VSEPVVLSIQARTREKNTPRDASPKISFHQGVFRHETNPHLFEKPLYTCFFIFDFGNHGGLGVVYQACTDGYGWFGSYIIIIIIIIIALS